MRVVEKIERNESSAAQVSMSVEIARRTEKNMNNSDCLMVSRETWLSALRTSTCSVMNWTPHVIEASVSDSFILLSTSFVRVVYPACIPFIYTTLFIIFIIASEMSKLQLMELFCFPSLSCGCEVLYVSTQQLSQLNACWNNAYRKVFKMNQ